MNLAIQKFKQKIANDINSSGLPISVISMTLELLLNEVKKLEQATLEQEMKGENQNEQEEDIY